MNVDPRVFVLGSNGVIPNNPNCPLLLYEGALPRGAVDPAARFERMFSDHGWPPAWRNGIFDVHHWHNTAHEVLGVYSGAVTVQLGGDGGPILEAVEGDVIVVPAGVAHKRLSNSAHLGVVGAYADGCQPDMMMPESAARDAADVVSVVPLPENDPVVGSGGPLRSYWGSGGVSPLNRWSFRR